jgi:glycosyltransferase involved in cell wall biosynthesis
MHTKKLAILCDWYLPGTKAGGPLRSVYALIELLKSEYDIYLITRNTDLGSEIAYDQIPSNEWFKNNGVNYYYFSKSQLSLKNIQNLLNKINCDVIYLNSFWSYFFSIGIIHLKNKGLIQANIVLAPRGMLGKGALEIKKLKKKAYLVLAQLKNNYKEIHFHATNAQEKENIHHFFKNAKVSIISNLNNTPFLKTDKTKQQGTLKLFFLSRIVPIKNLDFAIRILKTISADFIVEYAIYGNIEDEAYWNSCQKLIAELPSHIKVTYKGELNFHEVSDVISNEHCLLLPSKNENFGHSIVESLMCGCPAIISNNTPWNDLEEHGAGFSVSDKSEKSWKEIIESYARKNQKEFEEDSNKASAYISRKINIPLTLEQYISLFNGTR